MGGWTNVDLMLGQRRRRWANIKSTCYSVSCLLRGSMIVNIYFMINSYYNSWLTVPSRTKLSLLAISHMHWECASYPDNLQLHSVSRVRISWLEEEIIRHHYYINYYIWRQSRSRCFKAAYNMSNFRLPDAKNTTKFRLIKHWRLMIDLHIKYLGKW